MKYKLFGIDLDGTLLSKNKKISIKNLQAINRYINAGGIPVIITGRSFVSARIYAKKIEEYTQTKLPFLVGFNGAYIHNLKTNEIKKSIIDKQITNELWNLTIKNKCGIWVYPDEKKYEKLVYANKKWLAIFAKSSREVELKKSKISVDLPAYKINIMSFSPKKIKSIRNYLLDKYANKLEISYTHPLLLEITKKDVNKGYALSFIANSLNIPTDNVACIGDSGNDVAMAKVVGLSIGLKSRSSLLQKSVDIYLTNKTNGVAKAIDNYLIKENIELIVSDLDGTLLDDETKLVNNQTSKIISKAINQKKCQFSIATGRGLDDALLVYKNLNWKPNHNLYVIGTNGGFIYDCTNKTYIFKSFMDKQIAKELCDCFYQILNHKHKSRMGAQIFVDPDLSLKRHVLHFINANVVLDSMRNKTPYFLINNWAKKEILEINDNFNYEKIFKIVFFCENDNDRARLYGLILSKKLPLEISSSGMHNLEIMPKNISKGSAVQFLATYLKIDNNNVLTIGDEKNDISMLKQFKNSVTLKSSSWDVKNAAHFVIDAKASEVVGKVIKQIVFKNE